MFDIKEKGFPQPLPTYDSGCIFEKFEAVEIGENQIEREMVPNSSDWILPDPIDLIPPVIKQDLIIQSDINWEAAQSSQSTKGAFEYQVSSCF